MTVRNKGDRNNDIDIDACGRDHGFLVGSVENAGMELRLTGEGVQDRGKTEASRRQCVCELLCRAEELELYPVQEERGTRTVQTAGKYRGSRMGFGHGGIHWQTCGKDAVVSVARFGRFAESRTPEKDCRRRCAFAGSALLVADAGVFVRPGISGNRCSVSEKPGCAFIRAHDRRAGACGVWLAGIDG